MRERAGSSNHRRYPVRDEARVDPGLLFTAGVKRTLVPAEDHQEKDQEDDHEDIAAEDSIFAAHMRTSLVVSHLDSRPGRSPRHLVSGEIIAEHEENEDQEENEGEVPIEESPENAITGAAHNCAPPSESYGF
ncbi:MAG: hypothetical protein ACM3ZC_00010 [Bacteroidota bacterium]